MSIVIGDVLECVTAAHRAQRIAVTKVTVNKIEYRNLSVHGRQGRMGRLPRYQVERDYRVVQRTEEETPPMADFAPLTIDPEPTPNGTDVAMQTCRMCGNWLPQEDFDLAPTRGNGARHRLWTCHACMVAKRTAGIRATIARKKQEAETVPDDTALDLDFSLREPAPPAPVPTSHTQLAAQLLDLAAQVDAIEHPPAYRELFTAASALLETAAAAMGVWVLDSVAFDVLRDVVAQAQEDFSD